MYLRPYAAEVVKMIVQLSIILFVNSVLYASCTETKTKSLTFVIDDTRSMGDDIAQVRKEVDGIMDIVLKKTSNIEDIVLVTFNDPAVELKIKTKNRYAFKKALNSIRVRNYYNYDCPEYSLSGIERAIYESRPGSHIYVFTDASAKDYKKANKIKDLCQKTQNKVVFVLTGACKRPDSAPYQVYHDIAIASSGLFIEVNKDEVNLVVKTIGAFIEGNTNPVTSLVVPRDTIRHVPFTVDDKTDYVIVATTGKNIQMKVDGPYVNAEKIMWTSNSKMLQLIKPVPGNYTVHVKSSSLTHVVVYARTNFSFQHGFSQNIPKSIKDTSRKPIANMKNRLSILIEDPSDSVEIETAQILNMDEEPIGKPLTLREIGDNFYITEPFVSPESTFKLVVNGRFIDTGKPIRSLAKTPINPEVIELADNTKPTVTIGEGKTFTAILGEPLVLTCKVHAYPQPNIIWKDKYGNIIPSNSSIVEKPYDFISYLKLTTVTKTNKYYCKASNRFGSDEKGINIDIGDPFKVALHPEVKTRAKYGESTSLKCLITSDAEMKINWYYNNGYGTHKLHSSANYTISPDGTELVIKSMRKALVGKYTCNAVLLSDDYIHKKFTTDVEIYGYDVPIISNLISFLEAQDSNPVTIPCMITQGLPIPTIKWQFRTKGSFVDVDTTEDIQIKDDGLHIPRSQLQHNGQYKCIAENDAGVDEHVTTLTVTKKPETKIVQGTEIKIKYGGEADIECTASGNPLPKIEWMDEKGILRIPDHIMDKPIRHQYDHSVFLVLKNLRKSIKIKCISENTLGKDEKTIDIVVGQPFEVITKPEGLINVTYGEEASIPCEIKSELPMEISWYHTDEKRGLKTKISPSPTYKILLNGTVLKINSVDLDLVGKYTCEAALNLDENEKVSFDTELKIQGLKKPKVDQLPNAINVTDRSPVVIECRIEEGHPKPTITWQFQKRGSDYFVPMTETTEVLRIPKADLNNSGLYKCVVENALGRDTKVTDLLVEKVPMVKISEGSNITLPYASVLLLTCEVIAYPPPKIVWINSRGKPLVTKTPAENINHVYNSSIKISKMIKSDNYGCYASNKLGEVIENVDVTVSSPFEVEEKPEKNVNVDYAKSHTIKCHIKSSLNMKIQWYRVSETKGMNRLIKPSDKYAISSDGTELTIGFMEPNLGGAYKCLAYLKDDNDENISYITNIKITGLAPPEIDKSILNLKVKAKSNAEIRCRLQKGSPKPDIKWYFKKESSSKPQFFSETGEVLHISEVSLNVAGYYFCVAENSLGKDQHQIKLIVEAPPKIIYDEENTAYTAIVGDVVLKIPCNATGYPKPTVSWKMNGLDITPDSKYSIIDGALVVRTPNENDTLEYTCVAKNSEGEHSVNFEGIVTTGISDYENVYYIHVLEGSSKKINCLLPHSDSDKLRWFMDEEEMNNTESYVELKDASEIMDGNYSCRVSNENGYSMDTYVVDVGYPPTFKAYQEDEVIDWEGERTLLDCEVNAKPNVTVQWFYEGKPIKTDENELQLPIAGWGQYKCKITNPHGSVTRFFNVTSSGCLINKRKETHGKSPLLLTENLKWPEFSTNTDYLVIPHQEKLILSCYSQDKTNSFKQMPNKTKIEITCAGRDTFWMDGKIFKYSDLQCNDEVVPVVKRIGEVCLNSDTEMVEVGYELDEFVTVYKVCLDSKRKFPLYTQLNMMESNNMVTPSVYKWLDTSGLNLTNNQVYTCTTSSSSCCIAKEQLVNGNDVNFGPATRSTFINDLNSIPVWRNCDKSRMSWRQLEKIIRRQYLLNPQFGVWSGVSEYIKTDKGEIPQYLWKVVRFDETDSLAIIHVNDPHPKDSQILCKNVCSPGDGSWMSSRDKYTYCCELTDFLTAFKIPEEAIGGI